MLRILHLYNLKSTRPNSRAGSVLQHEPPKPGTLAVRFGGALGHVCPEQLDQAGTEDIWIEAYERQTQRFCFTCHVFGICASPVQTNRFKQESQTEACGNEILSFGKFSCGSQQWSLGLRFADFK